ncbi:MAG: DNA-3-methyladenine glycosylase [Gammaproteobacteria bacterium]|jgi:DNA-3-methyladenine glycosylase I|nr:DNA-3-methyladenine glycosylase [Gammaproteobacteria bacterium]
MQRCGWCGVDSLYVAYHDQEWGVPVYDAQKLFEFLLLETMQAGLSWITVLRKRENFRQAFDNFNPEKIAGYTDAKLAELLNNAGIIRHRLKIQAAVSNAKAFLNLQEHGNFSDYMWQFTEGQVIHNHWQNMSEVPARTLISDAMAKNLKQRGFSFVGSTVCYAHMQATGMVNDHLLSCFRHGELSKVI